MDHRQAFGAALREQRTIRRLSQEELAFRAGMDRGYISLVELGQSSPTLDTLQKLCAALGLQCSVLILRMEHLMDTDNGA